MNSTGAAAAEVGDVLGACGPDTGMAGGGSEFVQVHVEGAALVG